MKILHVITSLQIGGAEKLVAEIVPMLRDKGHEVDVLAFDGQDTDFMKTLLRAGIKVYSFGINSNVYSPSFILKLLRFMKHYDIVHTHNTSPQLFAAIGSYFCNTTLITTEHSTSNRRRDNAIFRVVDRWMYNRYKTIICISEKTKTNLQEHIGPTKANLVVINNGIDVKKYKDALPLNEEEKGTNKFVVTMVAGFRYQKDHETVIRAFRSLDSNKFGLWFIGDGERRDVIESCIKDNELNNVRLWGVRNDIPSILKSSDVIVQSSHIEGFGLAAVEGMAAGKPVIASDVDGLAQVVEGAGILFPHEDDRKLADEIIRLAEDKDYYDEIANKCSKRADDFDISKMVEGYESVYKEVMKS